MREARKTAALVTAAGVLVLLTWLGSRHGPAATLAERDTLLFPQFTDPNAAVSLEAIGFDEQSAAPRPFKVVNRRGHWMIPSHYDYPADAKDRLAQMASAVVTFRKEDFVSESAADHERYGVLDPLDPTLPGVKGRGTRITIRGENERLLADVVIGRPLAEHADLRYVRAPDQRAVYVSRVGDLNLSIRFNDWIDPDLLQIDSREVDTINVVNYSLDESRGTVKTREALLLQRKGEDEWRLEGQGAGETIDPVAINLLVTSIAGLRIVGVLPKPAGISAALSRSDRTAAITTSDRDDLARKGFYLTRDGRLLSSEGEIIVHTRSGVFYTLRFGEVAPGEIGAAANRENRFLFIVITFDPASAERGAQSIEASQSKTALLDDRFAPWYYIISADSFARIRVQRRDLVKRARG